MKLSDKDREAEKYEITGPCKEQKVTQESRQAGLDNLETTDDHGMVLVGIAKDQEGNRYYKVQNSWDTNQIYDGFFYVSEPYFLAKTMGVYLSVCGQEYYAHDTDGYRIRAYQLSENYCIWFGFTDAGLQFVSLRTW